jgi:hypothetical protein
VKKIAPVWWTEPVEGKWRLDGGMVESLYKRRKNFTNFSLRSVLKPNWHGWIGYTIPVPQQNTYPYKKSFSGLAFIRTYFHRQYGSSRLYRKLKTSLVIPTGHSMYVELIQTNSNGMSQNFDYMYTY